MDSPHHLPIIDCPNPPHLLLCSCFSQRWPSRAHGRWRCSTRCIARERSSLCRTTEALLDAKKVQKQRHEAPNSATASSPLSELTAAASAVQVDPRDLPMCLCLRANSLAGFNNQCTQHPSIYRRQGQLNEKNLAK